MKKHIQTAITVFVVCLLSTAPASLSWAKNQNVPAAAVQTKEASVLHQCTSSFSHSETVERLQKALSEKGLTVFALFDHQDNSKKAGLEQAGATVLVFGNPAVGGRLMQVHPEIALELPLKMLVVETSEGVRVQWYDFTRVAEDYGFTESNPIPAKMDALLKALASNACGLAQ